MRYVGDALEVILKIVVLVALNTYINKEFVSRKIAFDPTVSTCLITIGILWIFISLFFNHVDRIEGN